MKIDRIYINTPHTQRVHITFDDGSKYVSGEWETIAQACEFIDHMKQKYGRSEAYERRFQEWANFSEDKHPMTK